MNKQSNKLKNNFPKQLFVLALFLSVILISQAQIKVDATGKVGINNSSPTKQLDVVGDTNIDGVLTSDDIETDELTITDEAEYIGIYSGLLITTDSNEEGSLIPTTNMCGSVGTSSSEFYRIYSRYVYGNGILLTSDKRKKKNITSIKNAMDVLSKIEGKKFDFKTENIDTIKNDQKREKLLKDSKNHVGFLAQDLEMILPEAVNYDEENDNYYVDYIAIIPYLVEAIKEQQLIIDDLQTEVANLKGNSKEKSATLDNTQINAEAQAATLNQNIPNPFSETALIEMYIPATVTNAKLYIYNMQGNQIDSFTISERENTSVTIDGFTLNAGMYLYTLIADGKEADTKKMILTE